MLRSLNIAIGNFFFRRRNFVFPCVFLLTACTTTPEIFLGSQTLDLLFVGSGAVEAILGQTRSDFNIFTGAEKKAKFTQTIW